MGKTWRGEKGPGFDYQSKRNDGFQCAGYGKYTKKKTQGKMRTEKKKAIKRALDSGFYFDKYGE